MEIKRDEDRYYRTTNLSLAIYLFAHHQQVAGINDTDDSGEKQFAFVREEQLDQLVQSYRFGPNSDPNLMVNVRLYEEARRFLLDRLNGK